MKEKNKENEIIGAVARNYNVSFSEAKTEMMNAIRASGFEGGISEFIEYVRQIMEKQAR